MSFDLYDALMSFFISMVPLIEIRGGILYALASGVPAVPAYIICIIGNMLPVPVIFFLARKVLEWGKDKKVIGKFFTFCLESSLQKSTSKSGILTLSGLRNRSNSRSNLSGSTFVMPSA